VSSYDPPHPPWRRPSRDGSRRSWRASHHRSKRQQQKQQRRQPQQRRLKWSRRHPSRHQQRRLKWSRRHPSRLPSRCPPRSRPRLRQPHRRRQPHRQPRQRNPHLRRGRRRFLAQAYRAPLARLRPPLGSATAQLPRRGHGLVLPEDFLALPVDVVRAPRGLATTRSPRRREWVRRVHHVRGRMAPDLARHVRLEAVLQVRVLARAYRACRDPTRR
jgi:hypothetical protein